MQLRRLLDHRVGPVVQQPEELDPPPQARPKKGELTESEQNQQAQEQAEEGEEGDQGA